MRFGACVPAAYAPAAAGLGYDYVEVPVPDLCPESPLADFKTTAAAIERAGIPALAFNYLVPASLPIVGPSVDLERLTRYMEIASQRAAALGGEVFVLGSGPARQVPAGFDRTRAVQQYRTFAGIAGEAAERHGMTVALEGINRTETNFLHSLEEAVQHARAIARPCVGVLADVYHMTMEGEPYWHLQLADGLLRHVQVCDAGRSYPGSRSFDLWGFFAYLNQLGYDGTVSVECRWTSFSVEGRPALDFVRIASLTTGQLAFAP